MSIRICSVTVVPSALTEKQHQYIMKLETGMKPKTEKPQVRLNISLTHVKSADIEQALILY